MSDFNGDLLLFASNDGGEIELNDGNLFISDTGFGTAAYISLFGGNELDDGSESTIDEAWWGNNITDDPNEKLISRTQFIIYGSPAIPENLKKIKTAMKEDLAWMFNLEVIDTLNIAATIPEKNKLFTEIIGIKDGSTIFTLKYKTNWDSVIS